MREEFTSPTDRLIIIDEGFLLITKDYKQIIPRDTIISPLKIGMLSCVCFSINGQNNKPFYCTFCVNKEDKAKMKSILEIMNTRLREPVGRKLTLEDFGFADSKKEYRMLCKACGNLFCYTEADIKANDALKEEIRRT